jgi:hypothetical protein
MREGVGEIPGGRWIEADGKATLFTIAGLAGPAPPRSQRRSDRARPAQVRHRPPPLRQRNWVGSTGQLLKRHDNG